MSIKKSAVLFSVALSMAAFMNGCSSSTKDNANSGNVAKVDEAKCAQCHGSAREKLTGRVIYDDYAMSVHALNSVGCQDCHGGGAEHNGVGPIPFPKPSYKQCRTCHNDPGNTIASNYSGSKHFSVAIENEEGEPCQRCHTHQGAVLAAQFGFTGDKTVMAALVNAPGMIPDPEPIKCNTCHITHKPQDLRVDAGWLPSTTVGAAVASTNNQYRLCTQCHTYIMPDGRLVATATGGTTTSAYEHDSSWYRVIATTHYDNPATGAVEGYGIDMTSANPCFDCHGHESKTNTGTLTRNSAGKYVLNTAVEATIYTDWAKSAHAGNLLAAKYAAQDAYPKKSDGTYDRSVGMTNNVMAAAHTGGQFAGSRNANRLCVRCHTETGFKEYYVTTGDVTATTPTVAKTEILTCRGCHSNAATGALRVMKGAKAAPNYTTDLGHTPVMTNTATGYALAYGKKPFPDVAGSNLCITCHDGRTGDPAEQVTNYNTGAAITTPNGPHDMPAAAVMYLKMGYLNLSTGAGATSSAAYRKTLMSDQDGGSVTSTHRKLGTPAIIGDTHKNKDGVATFATADLAGKLASNGPCATCHLGGSHSLQIDQKAIAAVCNRCHSSEGGNDITTIAAFQQHFLEPQSEVFQNAIALAYEAFNSKAGQNAIRFAKTTSGSWRAYAKASFDTNYAAYIAGTGAEPTSAVAADYTSAAAAYGSQEKMFGALGNVRLFVRDTAAYAHARTYTRRLLYDSIDYLDDGSLNMTVGATALARSAVSTSLVSGFYGKGATAYTDNTLTTPASGTTESILFILGWSRSTGAWNAVERP
ncbi:MAG: cytochrome C [Geobacter sp.]|nr:cytochrome C [Geobacter sp.]